MLNNFFIAALSKLFHTFSRSISEIRDGPLENLWGGAGEALKKYSLKGKLNEKIHARQLTLKNVHATAWKKFDNEKNFLRFDNSPLPPPPPT